MKSLRPPAVAGSFYPRDAAVLAQDVGRYLSAARRQTPNLQCPKAILVPHAGYLYSASTAALAYARLVPWADLLRRVVLVGPAHRVAFKGIALPGVELFATPLGSVPVDAAAVDTLLGLASVISHPAAHAQEHALEVQLPFLQTVLPEFSVVPLLVGDASTQAVSDALSAVWGGPETLIVISSDLSHYHCDAQARSLDRSTLQAIVTLRPQITHAQACGATPMNGFLVTAAQQQLQAEILGLSNSGDAAGDRTRVVGYAAVAFLQPHGHTLH